MTRPTPSYDSLDAGSHDECDVRDGTRATELREVKRGEFFKRKPDANKTYSRGEYDREYKKFRCDDQDDISRDILLHGSTMVYIDFTY